MDAQASRSAWHAKISANIMQESSLADTNWIMYMKDGCLSYVMTKMYEKLYVRILSNLSMNMPVIWSGKHQPPIGVRPYLDRGSETPHVWAGRREVPIEVRTWIGGRTLIKVHTYLNRGTNDNRILTRDKFTIFSECVHRNIPKLHICRLTLVVSTL